MGKDEIRMKKDEVQIKKEDITVTNSDISQANDETIKENKFETIFDSLKKESKSYNAVNEKIRECAENHIVGKALDDLFDERAKIYTGLRKIAISEYKASSTAEEMLSDAYDIINSITLAEYRHHLEICNIEEELIEKCEKPVKHRGNWRNCNGFILWKCVIQLEALQHDPEQLKLLIQATEEKASSFYKKPKRHTAVVPAETEESTEYMFYAPVIGALISNRKPAIDITAGVLTVFSGDTKITLKGAVNYKKKALTTNAQKLLLASLICLNKQVNYRDEIKEEKTISIPLVYYAQKRNVANLHIKTNMDKFRAKTNKALEELSQLELKWEEKTNGRNKGYLDFKVIINKGIVNGNIVITFNSTFVNYMANSYIQFIDWQLVGLSDNSDNAFTMGLQLMSHYGMNNNIKQNTNDILKVSNLLKYTSLPDYEEVKASDRSYYRRIREPFENALNVLEDSKIIEWHYCGNKKAKISDDILTNMDITQFLNLYIRFKVVNSPIDTEAQKKSGKINCKKTTNKALV